MRTGNCWHCLCTSRKGDHLESNFAAKDFGLFMNTRLNMSQHQRQQMVSFGCIQECCWWDEGGNPPLDSALMWQHPKPCVQLQALQYQGDKDIVERVQWRVYTYLKKQCKEDGARFFSVVPTGRTGAERHRLKHFSQRGWLSTGTDRTDLAE